MSENVYLLVDSDKMETTGVEVDATATTGAGIDDTEYVYTASHLDFFHTGRPSASPSALIR